MSLAKQTWMELSSIQLGGVICLPVILIGHELAAKTSLGAALTAIVLGNALLFLLALISSHMAYESKKTTAENTGYYFGSMGKSFFALLIALTLAAWFAIQTAVMGRDLAHLLSDVFSIALPEISLNIISGFLMVACALFGIRGMTFLANSALPLMVATLAVALYSAGSTSHETLTNERLYGYAPEGLSLAIGAAISAVIDLPTFFRHAISKKDAMIASAATFLIGLPLIECVGVLLGFWTHSSSITEALLCSKHPLFKTWVALFILLAGWTTNNTNLYSASMSLQSAFRAFSERTCTCLIGGCALLLTSLPMLEHLSLVLDIAGIFIASMGSTVLTAYSLGRFFKGGGSSLFANKMSFIIGVLCGSYTIFYGSLFSQIAIVDAFVGSSCTLITVQGILLINPKKMEDPYEVYND